MRVSFSLALLNMCVNFNVSVVPSIVHICVHLFMCLDYIARPCSQEDDVHNIQSVIDSLSLDYLQISLSHITGIYTSFVTKN